MAIARLLEERFGQQDGLDIYSLLQMLYEFVLNRLNLLENGSTYPGYWKRMGAWMQAGLIAQAMTESSYSVKIDDFQQWLYSNMSAAGVYADFVQARQEPMLLAGRILLRNEILGRLHVLKSRHEREGRYVPKSQDIDQILHRSMSVDTRLSMTFLAPLKAMDDQPTPFHKKSPRKLETHGQTAVSRPLCINLQQFLSFLL